VTSDRADRTGDEDRETEQASDDPLPADIQERATRLTRHARTTGDPDAAQRYRDELQSLLAEHGYTARVRESDATLVLHPEEWTEDGTVRPDRIEDTDDAVEIPLDGPDDDWAVVERHNRRVVDRVAAEYGEPHADTTIALADYAGNHHESRIEHLTEEQIDRFREEYFPRNAWPSDEQRAVLAESVAIALEMSEHLDE
jgi:hypothetical protein